MREAAALGPRPAAELQPADRDPAHGGNRLWTLFKTCFFISACTFGGGMVIISMLQKKFVDELHWIEQDEMMDMVAIAQSCPGVMAVNVSIIIGCHVAGLFGALLTVAGTVTPPMVILTLVSLCYTQFRSSCVVALLLKGMQAGVAAVMINVSGTMVSSVLGDRSLLSLLMLAGAGAALFFGVDIIVILALCGVAGGIAALAERQREGRRQG